MAMHAPEFQHLLHYKISTDSGGVHLRIWERAIDPRAHGQAYLYIINHRFTSLTEAKDQLRQHLNLNGGILAQDQDIPVRGHVRLMPHPTLEY
jgi:hypothetical protein